MTELQRNGIDVPATASVTGFDDLIWSVNISPGLATMRMNMQKIAEIAVSNLVRQIEARFEDDVAATGSEPGQCVPMELIIRDSSDRAPP